MNTLPRLLAVLAALSAAANCTAEPGEEAQTGEKNTWDFAATIYPTVIRGGDNYTSAIVTADRGALHLEGRYNYEAVGARSAFIGWNFAGGDTLTWELTPVVGGAWGTTKAFVPGVEAGLAWGRVDFYTELEYVRHPDERKSSRYVYSWNELGTRPVQWLRLGIVAQRTRAYGGNRDVQAGPFVQLTWERFTFGGYWFNAGSSDQVVVVSIGVTL